VATAVAAACGAMPLSTSGGLSTTLMESGSASPGPKAAQSEEQLGKYAPSVAFSIGLLSKPLGLTPKSPVDPVSRGLCFGC